MRGSSVPICYDGLKLLLKLPLFLIDFLIDFTIFKTMNLIFYKSFNYYSISLIFIYYPLLLFTRTPKGFSERRDWDLNPGGAKLHKISSLAPYQARLSRHKIKYSIIVG